MSAPLVGVVGGSGSGGGVGSTSAAEVTSLWRVNLSRFLWDFKHTAIKGLVGDKLDSNAEGLVQIALNLQRSTQPYLEESLFREPFTVDAVLARCPQKFSDDGPLITWQLVLNYLDALCSDPLCKMASTLNGKYLLELPELSNAVKQILLEGAVRRLVGEQGCRLYRLLARGHAYGACSAKGQQKYELKQLAEMALLPERDARPLLWKLLHAEFILLQEVPRTVDRNPKTTTYLWHVSLPHAYQTLERTMFKTLANLHTSLVAARAEPSAMAAAAAEGGRQPSLVEGEATEEQRREVATARARVEALEGSVMRLFDTALLLRTM